MADPTILSSYEAGRHSANLEQTISRLDQDTSWRDLSCIMITPAGGSVPMRVVAAWENVFAPPNNRFVRLVAMGMEVGQAYTACVESILAHPELSSWKYICCREHDNLPPPDGLVKLLQQMEKHPEFAAIGGLYFTKGEGGVAQIWGDPTEHPFNFRPQKPDPNGGLVPCNGTGMGWTVFRLAMFKDQRLRRPWFKTPASREEGVWTQDLYAWSDFYRHGYKCAIDCSVRVGHYDAGTEIVW